MKKVTIKTGLYINVIKSIDTILLQKHTPSNEIEAIILALQEVNKAGFKKADRTPSIAQALTRASALANPNSMGQKIVKELLGRAKTLLIFEDMKTHLKKPGAIKGFGKIKNPEITEEDVVRIKSTNWFGNSKMMRNLIQALEKIRDKKYSKYKIEEKDIEKDSKSGELKEKIKYKFVTPVDEACKCLNEIRTDSKIHISVQIMRIIASDYLEQEKVELPKDNALFQDKDFSDDSYDIRVHQVLYNLSKEFEDLMKNLIMPDRNKKQANVAAGIATFIPEEYQELWGKSEMLKTEVFRLTSKFDENANAPTKVTKNTEHVISMYLHVLNLLKQYVKTTPLAKTLLVIIWKDFYAKCFHVSSSFNESDLSKNSMLANLRHVVDNYNNSNEANRWEDFSSGEEGILEKKGREEEELYSEDAEDSAADNGTGSAEKQKQEEQEGSHSSTGSVYI